MNNNAGQNPNSSIPSIATVEGKGLVSTSDAKTPTCESQLHHWQEVLLQLNQKINDPHTNFQDQLQHLTYTAASQLKVQRASIWRLNPLPGKVECLDFYNGHCGHHNTQWALQSDAIPYYINALVSDELLVIDNAISNRRTHLFYNAYLRPYDIRALMVIPIRHDDQLQGLFCLERTHHHDTWTEQQQLFAMALMLSASLVLTNERYMEQRRQLCIANTRFEHLMHKVPLAILETNADGSCFGVNEYWSLITGIQRDKALGMGWINSVHPDDRVRVVSQWNYAVRNCTDFNLRFRLQSSDGDITLVHGQAEFTRGHKEQSFFCVLHDLGNQK